MPFLMANLVTHGPIMVDRRPVGVSGRFLFSAF